MQAQMKVAARFERVSSALAALAAHPQGRSYLPDLTAGLTEVMHQHVCMAASVFWSCDRLAHPFMAVSFAPAWSMGG